MIRRWRSIHPSCGTCPRSAAPALMPCTGTPALDGASCRLVALPKGQARRAPLASHLPGIRLYKGCMQPRRDLRQITYAVRLQDWFPSGPSPSRMYCTSHNKAKNASQHDGLGRNLSPTFIYTSKAQLSNSIRLSLSHNSHAQTGVQCTCCISHTGRVRLPALTPPARTATPRPFAPSSPDCGRWGCRG